MSQKTPNRVKALTRPRGKPQTPSRTAGRITVGNYSLVRALVPWKVWIMHKSGEAMMTDEAALERALASFWKRNF